MPDDLTEVFRDVITDLNRQHSPYRDDHEALCNRRDILQKELDGLNTKIEEYEKTWRVPVPVKKTLAPWVLTLMAIVVLVLCFGGLGILHWYLFEKHKGQ